MGYVESNLLSDEHVVYEAHVHPIVYAPAIALGGFGMLLLLGTLAMREPVGFVAGSLFLVLAAGVVAVPAFILVSTSEFAVTNRRVIVKQGWLRRRTLELFLEKVESIGVDQDLLGRIWNYGTITVNGTGGTHEAFSTISAPLEFRRQVQAQIEPVEESVRSTS